MSRTTTSETVKRTMLGMYGPGDSTRVITRDVVRVRYGAGVRWFVRTTTTCAGKRITSSSMRFKTRTAAEAHVAGWVDACCSWRHQGVHSPLVEVAS